MKALRFIAMFIILTAVAACRTQHTAELRQVSIRDDSLTRYVHIHDTLRVKDSVFVKQTPDTTYIYKVRTEYRSLIHRDTLTKVVTEIDSIPYPVIVETTVTKNKMPWGVVLGIVAATLIIEWIIRRKFKL